MQEPGEMARTKYRRKNEREIWAVVTPQKDDI